MDDTQARTFLEIIEAGTFVAAAERLNVTQSTVSARIKELELTLGRPLFLRGRAGATLTPAGHRLRRHATAILRVWQQAKQEVALPAAYRASLRIGGQLSLWDRVLVRWLGRLRAEMPDVALQGEVTQPEGLMRQMTEGFLDVAILYSPESRSGLIVEPLLEETLELVSSAANYADSPNVPYVFVDWGPEFLNSHQQIFADTDTPGLHVSVGVIGLQYILEFGGAGYFPTRVVQPLIERGRLFRVEGTPSFARPAFAVYRSDDKSAELAAALVCLRTLIAEEPAIHPDAVSASSSLPLPS
ncbi:MAG: LysR family transcriptional regulator [Alphaproteobacteria bacterium]|nr:LysR family transcriptional regulator [Alphaproteobacteria bacterium]